MNSKIFTLCILVLLALNASASSQYQEEDIEVIDYDEQQDHVHDQQQQMKRRQQQFSMKRTACLVLSRYHSNTHKDMIESIVSGLQPEDQNKYINKLYATAVEHCLPIITADEATQFFVENPQFNPASMFYIYDGFDYSAPANNLDQLSADQKSIIKFMKQFDQEMAVKKQEREAQEQDTGVDSQNQMTIMGISLKGWGNKAQIAYMSVFLMIVGGGLWWGFSNLNNSMNPKSQKKKNKKKKA